MKLKLVGAKIIYAKYCGVPNPVMEFSFGSEDCEEVNCVFTLDSEQAMQVFGDNLPTVTKDYDISIVDCCNAGKSSSETLKPISKTEEPTTTEEKPARTTPIAKSGGKKYFGGVDDEQ